MLMYIGRVGVLTFGMALFVKSELCNNCKIMEFYINLAAIDIGEENI